MVPVSQEFGKGLGWVVLAWGLGAIVVRCGWSWSSWGLAIPFSLRFVLGPVSWRLGFLTTWRPLCKLLPWELKPSRACVVAKKREAAWRSTIWPQKVHSITLPLLLVTNRSRACSGSRPKALEEHVEGEMWCGHRGTPNLPQMSAGLF